MERRHEGDRGVCKKYKFVQVCCDQTQGCVQGGEGQSFRKMLRKDYMNEGYVGALVPSKAI